MKFIFLIRIIIQGIAQPYVKYIRLCFLVMLTEKTVNSSSNQTLTIEDGQRSNERKKTDFLQSYKEKNNKSTHNETQVEAGIDNDR